MTDIDRAAIRARIEHCKASRFGILGVIAGQDAPALLAALEDAEQERDALAAQVEQVTKSAREGLADCDDDCYMSAFWVLETLTTAPTAALASHDTKETH